MGYLDMPDGEIIQEWVASGKDARLLFQPADGGPCDKRRVADAFGRSAWHTLCAIRHWGVWGTCHDADSVCRKVVIHVLYAC